MFHLSCFYMNLDFKSTSILALSLLPLLLLLVWLFLLSLILLLLLSLLIFFQFIDVFSFLVLPLSSLLSSFLLSLLLQFGLKTILFLLLLTFQQKRLSFYEVNFNFAFFSLISLILLNRTYESTTWCWRTTTRLS